jgi:hypothetical protein
VVPAISLAEIVRHVEPELDRHRPLRAAQRRALRAIVNCRTPAMGGHLDGCTRCGFRHLVWHSCRNRHCPRCQSEARQRWLDARKREILALPYFHVVFTVPEVLNSFALAVPRLFYDILFRAANESLLVIGRDPRRLGLQLGFLAVLHTWGQTLTLHPHLHCVVPGGGFSVRDGRFRAVPNEKFLLSVRVLSRFFRRRFLELLGEALRRDDNLRARTAHVDVITALMQARAADWVVYAKPPFGGPAQVLAYLARYTHRIAISEHRLIAFDGRSVRFHYKDYRDHNRKKVMTLDAVEFLRRFLLHVLPDRFVRIRHYGFLGNRVRAQSLSRAREQLPARPCIAPDPSKMPALPVCPRCGSAPLITIETYPRRPYAIDSS